MGVGKVLTNPYVQDGRALLSKVQASDSVKDDVLKAVDLIGGLGKAIARGDVVLVKPNYNSADPPASFK